jgi:hypothetical protein
MIGAKHICHPERSEAQAERSREPVSSGAERDLVFAVDCGIRAIFSNAGVYRDGFLETDFLRRILETEFLKGPGFSRATRGHYSTAALAAEVRCGRSL